MNIIKGICDCFYFIKRRFCLILWISLVLYLFYNTFVFYENAKPFYYLREILGLGLCISRGTASVLNLCCALILLPMCKKLNQLLYHPLSKIWPSLFFFLLESTKSFHMTVGITLLLFSVIHSISHMFNLWNFSRGFNEEFEEINFARFKNESPLSLLMSVAGLTGMCMLLVILSMGLTSMRIIRRKVYNAFWYTHQLYLVFLVLLLLHPLSGVLKEQVLDSEESSLKSSLKQYTNNITHYKEVHKFKPIKSMTWMWIIVPLSCFFLDLLWRIFSRNLAKVDVLHVKHMPGRLLSLKLSCPHEKFECLKGQYVLLQCLDVSLIEWHPFTVVQVPKPSQREFVVWIRIKGDWTDALGKKLTEKNFDKVSLFVDGPFFSPMEGVCRSKVSICVAAGVGITPFVSVLEYMLENPRSSLPHRVHLLWIVKNEHELTWLSDIANKSLAQLRNANRPDRLQLEFYVTSDKDINSKQEKAVNIIIVNENNKLLNVIQHKNEATDEKVTLLTPNRKRKDNVELTEIDNNIDKIDNTNDITKEFPILECRVKRGRPHWDRVFGYWVYLYPKENLNVYCCGPKKLVRELRTKCNQISRTSKTQFNFIHEGFS